MDAVAGQVADLGAPHPGEGILQRSRAGFVVGEQIIDEGPAMGDGGLRSFRMNP